MQNTIENNNCNICDATCGTLIQLPALPFSDVFCSSDTRKSYDIADQEVLMCPSCSHVRLKNIIDATFLYKNNYSLRSFQSLSSKSLSQEAHLFLTTNTDRHFKKVLEIGCNDTYFLKIIASQYTTALGVDPIVQGEEHVYNDDKITVIGEYFTKDILTNCDDGFDLIIGRHVIEHIENIKGFFENLLSVANKNTLFLFEFPLLEPMVDMLRFDHVYHEHINYFSINSFKKLIKQFGLSIVNYQINNYGWGAGRFLLARTKILEKTINFQIMHDRHLVNQYNLFKEHCTIYSKYINSIDAPLVGYGASLTLPIINYHLLMDLSRFQYILDSDEKKNGMSYLNLDIHIKHDTGNLDLSNSRIVITALDATQAILSNVSKQKNNGIICPMAVI